LVGSQRGAGARLLLALLLTMVGVAGALGGAPLGAAAQDGGTPPGSLTVYNAICPPGYDGDDLFGTCYDSPLEGTTFTLESPDGSTAAQTTGSAGSVGFAGLADGTYVLSEDLPGDFVEFAAFCSNGADGTDVPVVASANDITFALTGGIDVVCVWYTIPVDQGAPVGAALEVYAALCPVGYEGDDLFGDCFDTPLADLTFSLTSGGVSVGTATTGADGLVRFEGLAAGSYVLDDSTPGDFVDVFVYCTFNGADPVTFGDDDAVDGVQLDIPQGAQVACDWYVIPEDLRAEPTVAPTTAPTAAPTVAPTAGPTPRATTAPGRAVVTLPNTGAGSAATVDQAGMGASSWLAVFALAVVAILTMATAIATRAARRESRGR
jgi:hypothetical protein